MIITEEHVQAFVAELTKSQVYVEDVGNGEFIVDGVVNVGVLLAIALLSERAGSGEAGGVELAARFIEKRRDEYVQEHGSYDPSTGVTEYPGNGEEYVGELEEIIEGIRALATGNEGQIIRDLVKALKWSTGESRSSLGDLYSVSQLSENVFATYKNGTAFPGWNSTREKAQAVAQEDYEARR